MLKTKSQVVLFKIISCIVAVLVVILVLMAKKIIDLVYIGLLFILILKYLIGHSKK